MREELMKQIIGVLQDEKVAKELEKAGSQEACYEAMKNYIPELEKTEFVEAMTKIKAATSADGTLNEEELEKIAGGGDGAYLAGAAVGAVAAAAAAL